jgi:hypothetical protein
MRVFSYRSQTRSTFGGFCFRCCKQGVQRESALYSGSIPAVLLAFPGIPANAKIKRYHQTGTTSELLEESKNRK